MEEVDRTLNEYCRKHLEIPILIIVQLELAQKIASSRSDYELRSAIILLDNLTEILLKQLVMRFDFELSNSLFDDEYSYDKIIQMDFKTLLKSLSKIRKIEIFEKFVFQFIHKTRNILYHKGFPDVIEYCLKVPDELLLLFKISYNFVSNMFVKYGKYLPHSIDVDLENICNTVENLKYKEIIGKEFVTGSVIFGRFFAKKWLTLTEMLEFSRKISSFKNPDFLLKHHEFWKKGDKGKPYQFKNSETFAKDFKKFKAKCKYKELVDIGGDIIKLQKLIENQIDLNLHKQKICNLLFKIDSVLSKYEDILYDLFTSAEEAIDLYYEYYKEHKNENNS